MRSGQTPVQLLDNSRDAFCDILRSLIATCGVICADQQHDLAWIQAIHLAVLQPPKHVLRAVTGESQVESLMGSEVSLPRRVENLIRRRPCLLEVLRDGVADHQQIDAALPRTLHNLEVSGRPPGGVLRDRYDRLVDVRLGLNLPVACVRLGCEQKKRQNRCREDAASRAGQPAFSSMTGRVSARFCTISAVIERSFTFLLPGT